MNIDRFDGGDPLNFGCLPYAEFMSFRNLTSVFVEPYPLFCADFIGTLSDYALDGTARSFGHRGHMPLKTFRNAFGGTGYVMQGAA